MESIRNLMRSFFVFDNSGLNEKGLSLLDIKRLLQLDSERPTGFDGELIGDCVIEYYMQVAKNHTAKKVIDWSVSSSSYFFS